jgi:hypothetical protein
VFFFSQQNSISRLISHKNHQLAYQPQKNISRTEKVAIGLWLHVSLYANCYFSVISAGVTSYLSLLFDVGRTGSLLTTPSSFNVWKELITPYSIRHVIK